LQLPEKEVKENRSQKQNRGGGKTGSRSPNRATTAKARKSTILVTLRGGGGNNRL